MTQDELAAYLASLEDGASVPVTDASGATYYIVKEQYHNFETEKDGFLYHIEDANGNWIGNEVPNPLNVTVGYTYSGSDHPVVESAGQNEVETPKVDVVVDPQQQLYNDIQSIYSELGIDAEDTDTHFNEVTLREQLTGKGFSDEAVDGFIQDLNTNGRIEFGAGTGDAAETPVVEKPHQPNPSKPFDELPGGGYTGVTVKDNGDGTKTTIYNNKDGSTTTIVEGPDGKRQVTDNLDGTQSIREDRMDGDRNVQLDLTVSKDGRTSGTTTTQYGDGTKKVLTEDETGHATVRGQVYDEETGEKVTINKEGKIKDYEVRAKADEIREAGSIIDPSDSKKSIKGDDISGPEATGGIQQGIKETIIAEAAAKQVALSGIGKLDENGLTIDENYDRNAPKDVVEAGVMTVQDYLYHLNNEKGLITDNRNIDYSKYRSGEAGGHRKYTPQTKLQDISDAVSVKTNKATLMARADELYGDLDKVADQWVTVCNNFNDAITGKASRAEQEQLLSSLRGALQCWIGNLTTNVDGAIEAIGKWAESTIAYRESQERYNSLLDQYNALQAKEPQQKDYKKTIRVKVGTDDKGNPEYEDKVVDDTAAYNAAHNEWKEKMEELEKQLDEEIAKMEELKELIEAYQAQIDNYGLSIKELSIFLDREEFQSSENLKALTTDEIQHLIDDVYSYDINKTVSSLSNYAEGDEVFYAGDEGHYKVIEINPDGTLKLENTVDGRIINVSDPRKIVPDGNTQHWGTISGVIKTKEQYEAAKEGGYKLAETSAEMAESGIRAAETSLATEQAKTYPEIELSGTVPKTTEVKPTVGTEGTQPRTTSTQPYVGPGPGPDTNPPGPRPTNITTPRTNTTTPRTNPTTPRTNPTTPRTNTTTPRTNSTTPTTPVTTYEPIPGPDDGDIPPIDIFGPGTGINSAAPTKSSGLTGLGALAGLAAGAAGIGALALGSKDEDEEEKEEKGEERREMVLEEQPIPVVTPQEDNIDILE